MTSNASDLNGQTGKILGLNPKKRPPPSGGLSKLGTTASLAPAARYAANVKATAEQTKEAEATDKKIDFMSGAIESFMKKTEEQWTQQHETFLAAIQYHSSQMGGVTSSISEQVKQQLGAAEEKFAARVAEKVVDKLKKDSVEQRKNTLSLFAVLVRALAVVAQADKDAIVAEFKTNFVYECDEFGSETLQQEFAEVIRQFKQPSEETDPEQLQTE